MSRFPAAPRPQHRQQHRQPGRGEAIEAKGDDVEEEGDLDRERPGFLTGRRGNYEIVEILGLYWHFVDLVWVFIFAFFYLW